MLLERRGVSEMKLTTIVWVPALCLLAGSAGGFLASAGRNEPVTGVSRDRDDAEDIERLRKEVRALRADRMADERQTPEEGPGLRAQVTALASELEAMRTRLSAQALADRDHEEGPAGPPDLEPPVQLLSFEEGRSELEHEPSDPSWSMDAERDLRSKLGDLANEGLNVESISCRSTHCSLEIAGGSEGPGPMVARVSAAIPWPTPKEMKVEPQPDGSIYLTAIIAREGYGLPAARVGDARE